MSGAVALMIYFAMLGVLTVGAFLRPPTALAAVNCIFGLKQWGQSTNAWLAQHTPVTNIIVGALVLCAIVSATARHRCFLCHIPKVTWVICALLLYSLSSLAWTPRPDLAAPLWAQSYPYMVTFIVLVPLVVHDTDDLRAALNWLVVLGGFLTLLLLIFGHWGTRGLMLGANSMEEETNPLALAGLGGSVAVTAMLLRPRRLSRLMWPLRLLVTGAALLLIVRSGSRGQLLAVVIAILAMLPVSLRMTSLNGMISAATGALVVAASLGYGYSQYIAGHDVERWSRSNSAADTTVRFQMVNKLLATWQTDGPSVLFGLGNSASWDPKINGIYPHNVPMEVLGEEGLVGFALYLVVCGNAIVALFRAARASMTRGDDRTVVAALGAGFLFFLFISFKQGNMLGSVEFFMYSILMARLTIPLQQSARAGLAPAEARLPPVAPFQNLMR